MLIQKVIIKNFRLFESENPFEVDNINIPDTKSEGSGLTVFVGENGCGKTSLLDAMALPILSYKAENFSYIDFNDPKDRTIIEVFAENNFSVDGTMPKGSFKSKGFLFEARIRARETKAYLSSIVVSDQKFIKADGEEKPKDGSPDLRINVNNPFKGQRFSENDILFLDKNRTFQIRSGTYNVTRFDRLMEDFDYQYIKKNNVQDVNEIINEFLEIDFENEFIEKAKEKFKELSGSDIELSFIDNWRPFKKGYFSEKKESFLQVNLNMLGSGYEMIFSLIYSFYLSQQSGKQLIAFIDEPELHLHPALQNEFVKFLLEISKYSQIILTSQSPLFIKQLSYSDNVKICIFQKNDGKPELVTMEDRLLPYVSVNEINYLAFDLPSVELHNELYGYIQSKAIDENEENYYENNFDSYLQSYGLALYKSSWRKLKVDGTTESYDRTTQTFIRNFIHHPENEKNDKYSEEELNTSIKQMINLLKIL